MDRPEGGGGGPAGVWKEVAVFLLLTVLLSAAFWIPAIRAGNFAESVVALMWCPGVAGILTNLLFRRTLRGLGWGWGGTRYQVLSYALPIFYATPVYALVWATVPGSYRSGVLEDLVPIVLVGSVISVFAGLGEEIGWRGFLVPRLARVLTLPMVSLVTGLVWFLWHAPMILWAGYGAGVPRGFALLSFGVLVVGISFPMTWLRLASGSLWTGAILHGSHNLFIQWVLDPSTGDTDATDFIVGEFGAGLAVSAVITAAIFHRLSRRLEPADGAWVSRPRTGDRDRDAAPSGG